MLLCGDEVLPSAVVEHVPVVILRRIDEDALPHGECHLLPLLWRDLNSGDPCRSLKRSLGIEAVELPKEGEDITTGITLETFIEALILD